MLHTEAGFWGACVALKAQGAHQIYDMGQFWNQLVPHDVVLWDPEAEKGHTRRHWATYRQRTTLGAPLA